VTHYPDMARSSELDGGPGESVARAVDGEFRLLMVGWLEPGHDYDRGSVSRSWFERLAELAAEPWQPAVAVGRHPCGFCVFTGGPTSVGVNGIDVPLGTANLWIPGEEPGVVYLAPSLVLHYIDAHEYAPPAPFLRAVEQCPPMRSMPYLRALRASGIRLSARHA
jgi:hypothetical protein